MPLAVCATPIGNLEDVTLRVLAELAAADVVLCEDTRHTRGLLERHGIKARLLSYHEHNEARRTAELLPRLEAGERIALVSDAGLPCVSDPGVRLLRAALDAGVDVTVLPGASAVETALVASGLVAEQYRFLGFLPRGESKLAVLWDELRGWPWPAVAFESPQRYSVPPKGEITLVLGPGAAPLAKGEEAPALTAVAELVAAGLSRRRAAEIVSRLVGIPRNRLYKQSL
jgi:16S rRNA (cytidine1402-2'-O)-methyltransferase